MRASVWIFPGHSRINILHIGSLDETARERYGEKRLGLPVGG